MPLNPEDINLWYAVMKYSPLLLFDEYRLVPIIHNKVRKKGEALWLDTCARFSWPGNVSTRPSGREGTVFTLYSCARAWKSLFYSLPQFLVMPKARERGKGGKYGVKQRRAANFPEA